MSTKLTRLPCVHFDIDLFEPKARLAVGLSAANAPQVSLVFGLGGSNPQKSIIFYMAVFRDL